MRTVNLAVVAALALLAAGPALAGDRGGGPGGGGCGSRCGGGHRPPPSPPHGGGFNSNINVNVNANANANANAFAGASAGGYFNARAYDVGGIRGGGHGGGTVYVGGGYGGDGGGYYGGGAVYNEEVHEGRTCASAPFGYVVEGFGRSGRRAPACVATTVCRGGDRGGRYGYSEHRRCDGGHGRYEQSSGYESYESYQEYGSYEEYGPHSGGYDREPEYGIGDYERGYIDGRSSCGGCRPDGHGGAPYPPLAAPEPPAWSEPPAWREPPPPSPQPRGYYSQEPGERG